MGIDLAFLLVGFTSGDPKRVFKKLMAIAMAGVEAKVNVSFPEFGNDEGYYEGCSFNCRQVE